MRKALICLLALLVLVCAVSCDETPESPAQGEPAASCFSPNIPEYSLITIYHYKVDDATGSFESIDDHVSYDASNIGIWQELVRVLERSEYTATQTDFDYTEYFDVNFYSTGTGLSHYLLSFSVNGVCGVEQKKCTATDGSVSFARLAEYYSILKNNAGA